MTIRGLLPLAALLAVVALIGCGGGSDSDQPSAQDAQTAYESIRAQIRTLGGSIGVAISAAGSETDAQLSSAFSALQQRAQAAVDRLNGLEVPDDVKAARQTLSDAIEQGGEDLSDIASAARASDAAAARDAVTQLVTDSRAIGEARAEFERALDEATQ